MLAIAGLATILLLLAAILSKRCSPLVAFLAIPLAAALALGHGASVGKFMLDGMTTVAPMGALFLFAILFFAILADAGLFAPIVRAVVHLARDHPPFVTVGTAVLATLVQLDGSGAVTFLVVVPALLPVYDRCGIDRRVLACVTAMAAGVGNMLPWGGPTIRAATALDLPVMTLFGPLLPVWAIGTAAVLACAWWLGRDQLARVRVGGGAVSPRHTAPLDAPAAAIGWRFWVNLTLAVAVLALMLTEIVPSAPAFLIGTALALIVNYPDPAAQREAIERHAPAAMTMVAILLAAGAFTGIMKGTGMLAALAQAGAGLLPGGSAEHLPVAVALMSMPLSLLFDPDSFYFGVLPVLGEIAQQGGVPSVEVGRAAILGQMTTGFPVSPMTPATFLLVGLARLELADHQRFTIPWLMFLTVVMTIASVLLGVIRL
ncbi:MAG TPA: citrate:proton symporter [Sphingomonas sp.]|jgi:CitMHS family citrate-Mg2+:H+ or citrate-Ca2+:H+ symporter|nr:citrate:proton symporter [Sphingomonas sp.]